MAKALAYVAQNQAALAIQDLIVLRDAHPDLRHCPRRAWAAPTRPVAAGRSGDRRAATRRWSWIRRSAEAQDRRRLRPADAQGRSRPRPAAPTRRRSPPQPAIPNTATQLGAALAAANLSDRAVAELTKVTSTPGYEKADGWIYLGQSQLDAKAATRTRSDRWTRRPRSRPTTRTSNLRAWSISASRTAQELHRPRPQGEGARPEGADAARLPDAHRRRRSRSSEAPFSGSRRRARPDGARGLWSGAPKPRRALGHRRPGEGMEQDMHVMREANAAASDVDPRRRRL